MPEPDEDYAESPNLNGKPWAAILAAGGLVSWTGLFVWANLPAIAQPASPGQWVGWISAWAPPAVLVCALWLLAMRSSRREAQRFGAIARSLHDESLRLEQRLATVNGELTLAREFLSSQSRDLDSLGRMAGDRLSQHADRLAALIQDNSAQVAMIGNVSEAALDNMEKLRGTLPVIAASARDVTNNIGNAGMTAHSQLQEMVNGFNRLNEFGIASEKQVNLLRQKVDEAVAAFARQADQMAAIADTRFATLAEQSDALRTRLDTQEIDALAAIRSRATTLAEELAATRNVLDAHEEESLVSLRARLASLRDESNVISRAIRDGENVAATAWQERLVQFEAEVRTAIATLEQIDRTAMDAARSRLVALGDEAARLDAGLADRNRQFDEELARRRIDAEQREDEAALHLAERLAALDRAMAAHREMQEIHAGALVSHADALGDRLEAYAGQMRAIADQGTSAETAMAGSLSVLAAKLTESREQLATTDAVIAALTDSSVRLLELIRESARHSNEDLTQAIGVGEARLEAIEARAFALRDAVDQARNHGEALSEYVVSTRDTLDVAGRELVTMHETLGTQSADHAAQIEGIRELLAAARSDTDALTGHAAEALHTAILALNGAARDAVSALESDSASRVHTIAARLGAESGAAIDKVMRARMAEATGQLEQAAAHAAGVSREAAIQLRDQLAKVNELAGNLERRVEQVRQRAEEQVDNDFSRRVALITESLNSNAIDIARVLDTDVTDTAWASYLRGDRGIFTRRAVRLLDSSEAKSIASHYESDRAFRDHVSHYIHDFEAMLRQMLSTRDGHALGVTLLSSDMGKLYVALAQAIERFRA